MRGAYLLALLAALGGVTLVDARLRLVLWLAPRVGAAAIGAGVALFLAWDAVALTAGYYSRGGGRALLGIDVLPRLPVEEVVFVTFLAYLAAVLFALATRLVTHWAPPTEPGRTEPGRTEPGRTEPDRTEPDRAGSDRATPGRAESDRAHPGRAAASVTSAAPSEPATGRTRS